MAYRLDLRSAHDKLNRARFHHNTLKGEPGLWSVSEKRLMDADRVRIVAKYDPQRGRWLGMIADPATRRCSRISSLVGDIVHNLRATLDHIAWQLAVERAGGAEPKNPEVIQFPIRLIPEEFRKAVRRLGGQIDGARIAQIGGFQPYPGTRWEILAAVHNLDIHDKHRSLTDVRLTFTGWQPFPLQGVSDLRWATLPPDESTRIGAELVSFTAPVPSYPDEEVVTYISADVFIHGDRKPVKLLSEGIFAVEDILKFFNTAPP